MSDANGDLGAGHKHNDDLGLIYINARYYVVGIGRFASADTIVPDPMNPQQYNRYSYTLNNPLKYIDPSGHFTEKAIIDYLEDNYDDSQYMYEVWKSDERWWAMIRTAQAGDVIFMVSIAGKFAATFTGDCEDLLTGLELSDPYGNVLSEDSERNGMPSNFGFHTILNNGFISEDHGGPVYLSVSNGFIRWTQDKQRIAGVYPENVKQTVPRGQWVRDGINSAFSLGSGALGDLAPVKGTGSLVVKYLPNALASAGLSISSTSVSNWWTSINGLQEHDVTIHLRPIEVIVNRGPIHDEVRLFRHQ